MPITQVNNLITNHTFNDQQYMIRLNIIANTIELYITDKQIGEEWYCNYDQTYIENLTSKTGNFKKFEVFAKMLKSGLMNASHAISLDLLTYDDLQYFRLKCMKKPTRNAIDLNTDNRRFLILIYTVEFDRIIYPLPLDYCGAPDTRRLVEIIRRLDTELSQTKQELANNQNGNENADQILRLTERIAELTDENEMLRTKIDQLQKTSAQKTSSGRGNRAQALETAITKLEKSVVHERRIHQKLVDNLKKEKAALLKEVENLRRNESVLKQRLDIRQKSSGISSLSTSGKSRISRNTNRQEKVPSATPTPVQKTIRRNPSAASNNNKKLSSRASSKCSRNSSACASSRASSNSRSKTAKTTNNSVSSRCSSRVRSENIKMRLKTSEQEYKTLENKISELQTLLRSNMHK